MKTKDEVIDELRKHTEALASSPKYYITDDDAVPKPIEWNNHFLEGYICGLAWTLEDK